MGKYKGFAGSGMNANKNMSNVIKQAQKCRLKWKRFRKNLKIRLLKVQLAAVQLQQLPLTARKKFFRLKSVLTLLILKILKHLGPCYGCSQRCSQKADDMMAEGMSAVTGGINIPGLF